jgi:hypothetical protein
VTAPPPAGRPARCRVAAVLLVVPLLAACGVETQREPQPIPTGVLPTELRRPPPTPSASAVTTPQAPGGDAPKG